MLAFAEGIQLFPDGTLLIHVALILLMIYVLNRTFFRPINRVIESREKSRNIEGGEVGGILSEVEEKESRYNSALLEARSQGYELLEKEHGKLVRAREKKLAETKAETDAQIGAERAEIERQAAEARASIEAESDKLADQIAATVLRA